MFRKPIALLASIALAMSLCPATALANDDAADLAAGRSSATKGNEDTVLVRKITGYCYIGKRKHEIITYGENGLISKYRWYYGWSFSKPGIVTNTYSYDGNGKLTRINSKKASDGFTWKRTFKYDKKGRLLRQRQYIDGDLNITITYTHSKNGKKVKALSKQKGSVKNDKRIYTITFNKLGYVSSVAEKLYRPWNSKPESYKFAYSYNKQGYLVKRTGSFGKWYGDTKLGNETYKITQYTQDSEGRVWHVGRKGPKTRYEQFCTLMETTVPKRYAAAVRAQQHALMNPSIYAPRDGIDSYLEKDFTLGDESMDGGFAL